MLEVKSCPMCGGKAVLSRATRGYREASGGGVISDAWYVACCACGVETKRYVSNIFQNEVGDVVVEKNGAQDAVSAWNERVQC